MERPVLPGPDAPPQPALLWDAYTLLGRQVLVGCDTEGHQAAIRAVLAGFGPRPVIDGDLLPRFALIREQDGWRLDGPGATLSPAAEFSIALSALEWHVINDVLSQRSDLFQMHAGAVCLPTRRAGLVLAGQSTSGKSTLTLALMLRGFAPFGDDVTLIDSPRLELQAFPRAFHVDDRTWDVLAPLSNVRLRPDAAMPAGHFAPPQWAHMPAPVGWMVFPQFEAGRTPELIPLRPSESVTLILEHSGSLHRDSRLALKTAARLAETVRCYRMAVGEIVESVNLLQRLVYA